MRWLVITVWVVALITPAHADPETILVISSDPAFQAGVTEVLAPEGMVVRVGTDPTPSIGDVATASRTITDREHAIAMVWLLFVDQGATLIVYDRGVDRVLVRSLSYGSPLDDAQAAEAARVTRTMLRALRVEDPRPPPPPPSRPPPPPEPRLVVVSPPPPSRLAIDLDGGVRMRGPGTTAAPAGALGVIWFPDRLGLVLVARLAPSATLDGMLSGRISDQSLSVLGRLPLSVTDRIAVATTVGGAVHRIALTGTLDGADVSDTRYDPALRGGLMGGYALNPTIGLGLGVSADWLLRRQTYEVGASEVLTVPIVQVVVGVVLSARIL